MGSGNREVATGRYTGTGAAKNVALSFAPKVVIIINETDKIVSIKNNRQPVANHTQIAANGTITQITTEGVTIPEPASGDAHSAFAKFSLGTNAGVNGSAKECSYMAFE